MAPKSDAAISVRIMVDREKNRIICAEAGNDFVDALFSFLTLPMGTIIRLLRDQRQQSRLPAADIGCLSNLYRSVEKLGSNHLWTDACKDMLLRPRNPCENYCSLLKVNVDDTKPKYFICPNAKCNGNFTRWSYYADTRCSCGKTTNRELSLDCGSSVGSGDGVFLWASTVYIVHDDLKVTTRTPVAMVELLSGLGITNVNRIEERVLNVGLKEVLILLERSLLSKSPLTDVFLTNERKLRVPPEDYQFAPSSISERETTYKIMEVKILVKKSTGKVLYAEAEEDFVDLLFSFLTISLGSVITLLSRDSSLGCLDNLYKSVESLDGKWFVDHSRPGEPCKMSPHEMKQNLLLNPGLTAKFGCSSQPFGLNEIYHPLAIKIRTEGGVSSLIFYNYFPGYCNSEEEVRSGLLIDPKEPRGRSGSGGFVKRPAAFQVYDDLVVRQSSSISSSISFLRGLGEDVGVAIDDIEEHVIKITKQEGKISSLLKTNAEKLCVYFKLSN